MQKSSRFFIMMLPAFLARVKPLSTIANPACMKNTRAPATIVQTMSVCFCSVAIAFCRSSIVGAGLTSWAASGMAQNTNAQSRR